MISGPESEFVDRSGGGNQGIAELDLMTFRKPPQVVASSLPNFCIDWNAGHRSEQVIQRLVFPRAGAVPDLRDCYGRTRNESVASTQILPPRKQSLVSSASGLNQNVRVDQDGFQRTLLSRVPLRRRRTYDRVRGRSVRSRQSPAKARMACRRHARPLAYFSRTASRTRSEMELFDCCERMRSVSQRSSSI